jgi:hypothetical protein
LHPYFVPLEPRPIDPGILNEATRVLPSPVVDLALGTLRLPGWEARLIFAFDERR